MGRGKGDGAAGSTRLPASGREHQLHAETILYGRLGTRQAKFSPEQTQVLRALKDLDERSLKNWHHAGSGLMTLWPTKLIASSARLSLDDTKRVLQQLKRDGLVSGSSPVSAWSLSEVGLTTSLQDPA